MTLLETTDVAIIEPGTGERSSYVDWPAIIAGIVLATAISLVLISFGSALGLNFVDFGYGKPANPIVIGILAASWFLWVEVSSFMAGGYLTGRLRRRNYDASEDESDLRDGAHGLLVWAGAAILGAVIAVSGVGAAVNAAGTAASAAASAADDIADPNAYFVDTLFRAEPPVDAGPARDEAGRILARAALGEGTVSPEDRAYLATLVTARTGLAPDAAIARVDQVDQAIATARAEAVEAARITRNGGIIGAFLLAASLLISAIGAYWAAQMGGNHRDNNIAFPNAFRRF
ncbi:MAG: hypothetical protein ABS76_28130 [Pelagibacterium sp. SCN 64-44]|nr:MAG: hypothetical protein ABS76_28130 [Pelagibacterium sp. SCN 64-44]